MTNQPLIQFLAPVTINATIYMMPFQPRDSAPVPIIDQPPAAPQIAAPDVARLYAPDVERMADQRFGPRPYYLTLDMRRQIAAQLDAD